jgi:hypothetical protein
VRLARDVYGITMQGRVPKKPELRDIAWASGLPRFLGVSHEEPPGFVTLGLLGGRKRRERADASTYRERVATELTTYVNACLERYNWTLNRRGARYFSSIAGEVIGNAEDHSLEPYWWVAAYLHQGAENSYGDCHITIFNFGRTLYESMCELPEESVLRRRIRTLVEEHTRRGFWRPHWTEENLWTLYALQEGSSRYQVDSKELSDRGQGTADMIQFFQELGQSEAAQNVPKMCVVSGRTHILFDTTYPMTLQETESGTKRRIIALNEDNDLRQPPDRNYVRHLKRPFPGTLISLRFYLDEAHLRNTRRADGSSR